MSLTPSEDLADLARVAELEKEVAELKKDCADCCNDQAAIVVELADAKAEVERLHDVNCDVTANRAKVKDELDAYRAAVAEMRPLLSAYEREAGGMLTLSGACLAILDKLPRDEP